MNLGKGYTGAAASAIASRKRALDRYYNDPNLCKKCGLIIDVKENQKVQVARKKKFCNASCSAKFNNHAKPKRVRASSTKTCPHCLRDYIPRRPYQKFCSNQCSTSNTGKNISKEELLRRGFTDPIRSRERRLRQIEKEENIADGLRGEGWEVFSPTVVCDRVGVKDGKVFFLEFKPPENQRLRPGQKRIADLVPEMYRIIT